LSTNRAVIVDAVRTPGGKRNGYLSGWHPVELAATVLDAVARRNDLDPALVDDVVMGCVTQVGAQSSNISRSAVLSAGWPESVPGTTLDRQCGSSQQAIHFAAQGIMSGTYDVAVAAGVEMMSVVPMFSSFTPNIGDPYGPVLRERYAARESFGHRGLVSQGISAELVAERWSLTREELDEFGYRSQQLAAAARDSGRFTDELVPVAKKVRDVEDPSVITVSGDMVLADQGIRETSPDVLAGLKPAFLPDGRVTAGNSSQICDGAAAVLLMSEQKAAELGMRPLASIRQLALAGSDPVEMLTGPIPATRKALQRAGLSIDDIDLFEVNEAFASVVLSWMRELKPDETRVNVNGGGIALGHPLGGTGAKLMATLAHELRRRGGRYGLQTMCEGGGMANATIIEAL
jgi:acetyl-CoA acetyltransferase family protein